jgi:hypothetical protein
MVSALRRGKQTGLGVVLRSQAASEPQWHPREDDDLRS